MVSNVQSTPVQGSQKQLPVAAAKATQDLDQVLDTFARVPSNKKSSRASALGKPGANVSINNGEFNVSGSSLWNPTCWPLVTLCAGSWAASAGSAITSSKY